MPTPPVGTRRLATFTYLASETMRMQSAEPPVRRDIVLIGGGHSHVAVLRRFAMHPEPGIRLTLVCRDTHTPYSGMLPGYVAGHYDFDEVHIDLRRLAQAAGARFVRDEAIGIARTERTVTFAHRPPLPYDKLSINIGSTPRIGQVPGAQDHAVAVKPIREFRERWRDLLTRLTESSGQHQGPMRLAVVGGGAGGVELLLAMQYRLRHELDAQGRDPDILECALFTQSSEILPTHNRRVRARFTSLLKDRGVAVHVNRPITRVEAGRLIDTEGEAFSADETVWVTQAGGAAWLEDTGLALDKQGFIRVNDYLQSVSDPDIFAAGDIANQDGRPREKAGVFAVRQGRPLADNLRASLIDRSLTAYCPQRQWLALISSGDRYAVASRGPFSWAGAWLWRWKDRIDRRFMARFNDLPAMTDQTPSRSESRVTLDNAEHTQALSALAMRCGGCGAKVGASVLSRALAGLSPIEHDDVLVGLASPDDAAVVRVPPGKAMVHSIDFFRAFIDDPYVFGQVAAHHALGDIFAMGAKAQTAMAVATVPPGLEAKVEDTLRQMMTGAVEVLDAAGCQLVGGHTGEGQELALGFSINGLIDEAPEHTLRKDGLNPGDALILTKPLGTGTLFAAQAQLAARGHWIDAALDSMCQSNQAGATCLQAHGARACTDVTGFGLLGHLIEMTRPSGVDAELSLSALPLLEGAEATAAAGILSSLQPANARLRRAIRDPVPWREHPRYGLLFDPQTAGGLLAGIPADDAEACVAELRALGYHEAAIIGRVISPSEDTSDDPAPIRLRE
ncbi:selenide, water dikinase SelD [Onishia niordana]|uniref:selenide, water dikinase SelD n=1 Tax=Onishia niordana TaxID=2508711 RepID=UPI00197B01C4|nr:selenide, water dikinase SelD [Halomonas niordiana]